MRIKLTEAIRLHFAKKRLERIKNCKHGFHEGDVRNPEVDPKCAYCGKSLFEIAEERGLHLKTWKKNE